MKLALTTKIRGGIWALLVLVLTACNPNQEEIAPQVDAPETNEYELVNNWILENMKELYYWNDKLPADPDKSLSPDLLFESLLYAYDEVKSPDGDRYSYIEDTAEGTTARVSATSKTTGMEFALFLRLMGSSEVIGQVLYVLPDSPAQQAGLKRGDLFYSVNGQRLTTSNYISLLFGSTDTFSYKLAQLSSRSLVDTDQVPTVTAQVFEENPVFMDSVYTLGNKKVGYLVYSQFKPGPEETTSTVYDSQLDAIFGKFKAQGVNELVLDLRYNPGGYTSSSVNLASLIGKGISPDKVYFREEWNATVTTQLEKSYGSDFFLGKFAAKSQNIGDNLPRLIVLTTDYTASASELIINGLRPYMTVTTIGSRTYGKNVGSITFSDETGKTTWTLHPIVFKAFNSLGQTDYTGGFAPTIEVEEPIDLLPLGDTREALLNEALYLITGTAPAGRRGVAEANPLTSLGSSIQRKSATIRMIKSINNSTW